MTINYWKYIFLLKNLRTEMDEFILVRKELEAINLIKSYYNEEKDSYLFIVNPPFTANSFFRRQILVNKLKIEIGDKNLNIIRKMFQVKKYNFNEYLDITSTIDNIHDIKSSLKEVSELDYFSRQKNKIIVINYDWLQILFKKSIILNDSILNNLDFKMIKFIANLRYIYGLNNDDLINILENSVSNNEINEVKLKQNSSKAIKFKLKNRDFSENDLMFDGEEAVNKGEEYIDTEAKIQMQKYNVFQYYIFNL